MTSTEKKSMTSTKNKSYNEDLTAYKGGAEAIEKMAEGIAKVFGFKVGDDVEEKIINELEGMEVKKFYDEHIQVKDTIQTDGKGNATISLNSKNPFLDRRFTLAHELGHYFLHSNLGEKKIRLSRSFINELIEREANYFAACLLMPKKEYKKEFKKVEGLPFRMVDKFKVSISDLTDRAKHLGLIK